MTYEATPELIKATAEVLYKNDGYTWPDDADTKSNYEISLATWRLGGYFERARAVLAVVVPLIREQIAAEIEKRRAPQVKHDWSGAVTTWNEALTGAAHVARGEDR